MNATAKFILIEKEHSSVIQQVLNIMSRKAEGMDKPGGLLWTVRLFLGLKTNKYKKSRIIRKQNKAFDNFIFKGYDQLKPGLSRPGSFKKIGKLCKN